MSATLFHGPGAEEAREMLKSIGLADFDQLFKEVPRNLQTNSFDLPEGISELEMNRKLSAMAEKNNLKLLNFCGGGFYDHFIPAAVDALANRAEFYTAYTPYQPEAAQGTLQAIYEYQSAICRLTGMTVANASLYDGGTAVFEAAMMALRITRRQKVLLDAGINPLYRAIVKTHSANQDFIFEEIPLADGLTDHAKLAEMLDDQTAAVIFQNPNFFGAIDDYTEAVELTHKAGALAVFSVYPISLGLLKTPGEMGADIVIGEGQSLGLPLSCGGPYLGFMATDTKYVHRMPGRLVGAAKDAAGKRGFVLTLQAREQHIRREKATSNICSNQALCALRALIHLSLLGKAGLVEYAEICAANAAYAMEKLTSIPGVTATFPQQYFNEFSLTLPKPATEVVRSLLAQGFAAGLPLSQHYPARLNDLLMAFTEKHTKTDIDSLTAALASALK